MILNAVIGCLHGLGDSKDMNHDWMEQTMVYKKVLQEQHMVDIDFENEIQFIAKEMLCSSVEQQYHLKVKR